MHTRARFAAGLIVCACMPALAQEAPPAPELPPPAPTGQLEGLVLKRGDRTPVAGVTLVVDDDLATTATGADGAWALDAVPAGKHTLHLRGGNIVKSDAPVEVTAGQRRRFVFWVAVKEKYSTTVRGKAEVREVPVEQSLSGDELRHLPGAQGDTLKAVQNLPGVARAPFGIGLLVVWGSAPEDTRTYVDGVYIPTLFHFGGLRSTVNSEMVDQLNFLPGGYGVDYGRGLGGVVEVETRRPRDNGYHGYLQLDLIDGSLMLEGKVPFVKNLSFAVAARRSWIDVFLPLFTSNDFQLSPQYTDYQLKLDWRPTRRDVAELFIFGSDDTLALVAKDSADANVGNSFNTHTQYHRALLSYRHFFAGGASVELTASGGYDQPAKLTGNFGKLSFTVDEELVSYNVRAAVHVPIARWLRGDAGVDFEGNHWGLTLAFSNNLVDMFGGGFMFPQGQQVLWTNGTAPWVRASASLAGGRIVITPELRVELLQGTGTFAGQSASSFYALPEPRVHLRFGLASFLDFRGTIGIYHQAPDPNAVLLEGVKQPLVPEFGMHYVAGFEARPTETLSIQLDGFYKELRNLVESGEANQPNFVNDGVGRVYGGQLLIRQQLWKGFFGWISYTLSRSERKEHADVPWHVFSFDQTHILTLIASYKFGNGYQVGLRFRYVTGNPTTPVIGAYQDLDSGRWMAISGPALSSRLGDFNQLDVRFDKAWTFERFKIALYVDIQNVYNAKNPEGVAYNYNYTKSAPVSGLPFLPVLGTRGDF